MSWLGLLLACSGGSAPAETAASTAAPAPAPREAVAVKPAERDERWVDARCNDGSPFAYRYRPGAPGATTWVVNLAGGFFCDDQRAPCAERKPRLRTTLPAADGAPTPMKSEGIFSLAPGTNPTFATAHHVDAHYCSSDLWVGDRTDRQPNSADPEGWFFSGRRNVAVLF